MYASLVRRQVKDANEGMRFGQISRVIGDQVRIIQDLDVLKVHIINLLVFLELTNRYHCFYSHQLISGKHYQMPKKLSMKKNVKNSTKKMQGNMLQTIP